MLSFVYLSYFRIFQNKLFCHMIYVCCSKLSVNICIRNNILSLVPIILIILFMIISYTALLNTCKTELAHCFHLFPQLIRQVFISTSPENLHKTAVSPDVILTETLKFSL